MKTNKPVNSGWSLENQGTGLQLTGRALHVLVVDDNRDAADSLCMLLRLWGYDCLVAYDGAAGLQAACDYRPDCLLIDIAMPGLDGYTLARRVRAQPGLDDAKLVALTAFSDETHVRRSQEAGFHFHLVKPTEPLEIKRIMNMLNELIRLASGAEEMTRQNVALASETKELLKEVKEDMQVPQDRHRTPDLAPQLGQEGHRVLAMGIGVVRQQAEVEVGLPPHWADGHGC